MKTIIIVGNGIAAQFVLFSLTNNAKFSHGTVQIKHIYNDDLAPPCSLRSTATISLRGVQKGISALGDSIVESMQLWNDFYMKYQPKSMMPAKNFVYAAHDSNFERRYSHYNKISKSFNNLKLQGIVEDGYIFKPDCFMSWLNQMNQQSLQAYDYEVINELITEVPSDSKILSTHNGKSLTYDHAFLCCGAYSKIYLPELEDYGKTKIREGSYWSYNGPAIRDSILDELDSAYSITYEGINFIYRKTCSEYIIGATTDDNGGSFFPNISDLKIKFEVMAKFLCQQVELPSFDDGQVLVGLRHQGPKRQPRTTQIPAGVTILDGTYKNGYMLALWNSSKVVGQLSL